MWRMLTVFIILSIIATPLLAQTYISSTSANSDPLSEGLHFIKSPTQATLDNWTATTSAPMLGSPKLADLNGDGIDEIILATYGIINPYGEGWIHAWDGAGNELPGFPIQVIGAAPGTPAVGDIDNDGDLEIVQGTWNYLYVFNGDGTLYPGYPIGNYITQAVTLTDLDNIEGLEIIVPSSNAMHVYHSNGSGYGGFPVYAAHSLTAAAVADLDGDFQSEIVAGSFVASGSPSDSIYAWHSDTFPVSGFPVPTAGSVKVPPVIADLDNNGTMEIIADCWSQTGTDQLYVWDDSGSLLPGWPQAVAYCRLSSPSVGDIDNDGDLEIIVGGWSTVPSGEKIHAYHHDGATVAGFPVVLNNAISGNLNNTPVVGDIDGDGLLEIVIKAKNNVFALNHDGSVVTGFPVPLDDENHSGTTSPTPVLGDTDGDGLVEIFAAACYDNVLSIDMNGAYNSSAMPWPSYQFNAYNWGAYLPVEPQNVSVSIFAVGGPIVIPASGGVFDFTVTAFNLEPEAVTCDVWISAEVPGIGWVGPFYAVYDWMISSYSGVEDLPGSQIVPARAPAGTYTYAIHSGQYPDVIWNQHSFTFEKLGDEEGGIDLSDWICDFEMADDKLAEAIVPEEIQVTGCYPNPFNPVTVIGFQLPASGEVTLSVYDISGRLVAELVDGWREAGWHNVTFDGSGLASGIYIYQLTGGKLHATGKMLLVK
ncbi:T9SS type A sorting domain-containing protein [bacterium]|nr:T9SS type A sorting domain-containing protein [bacterium]